MQNRKAEDEELNRLIPKEIPSQFTTWLLYIHFGFHTWWKRFGFHTWESQPPFAFSRYFCIRQSVLLSLWMLIDFNIYSLKKGRGRAFRYVLHSFQKLLYFSKTGKKWLQMRKDLQENLHKLVKVSQSCLTLFDPMVCTIHGILQARILE